MAKDTARKKAASPVAVLGAGPAGRALGGALTDAGYPVAAVFSRNADNAARAVKMLGAAKATATANAAEAAAAGEIVVFAVPDKVVAETAGAVAAAGGFRENALAFHLSGALASSVLEPAHLQGVRVGSLHPMRSFAGGPEDRDFRGVCFGLEGDEHAVPDLERLVKDLGGTALKIRTEDKPVYHLASSIVSNFTVALFHQGLTLLESIGLPSKPAAEALTALLRSTTENVAALGVPEALTGPIARGDVETVAAHMEALKSRYEDRLPLYAALARYTVEVALRKGTLHTEEAEVFKSMLARYI